ncbi:PilZ domain-containing protein [Permianibacter aggregans]|uniref:PilZ domain-containing protein n=1 Tax=Permianibacter aggregans TaxID=1510150 RepID=A0A4R6UZW2_9GAMM|nr:PilZ domain-containing protein [Permianibacter aggregans]QGX41406.1 PilZ domain-containing protein [Permianibacter aggregans]TDQ51195.1 PilZ domain-containing protein [Permianibacter aggregans]
MMNLARDYAEKRDFIRMFVDAKVSIVDLDSGAEYHGEAKNLSGKGLMFEANFEPALDAELRVTVASMQSRMPPLVASFKVVRVIKKDDGMYEIAGELSNVS